MLVITAIVNTEVDVSFRWRLALAASIVSALAACTSDAPLRPDSVLRVAIDTEPSTWNRLLATDWSTHVVTDQLHAPLIRLNPQTQKLEPALAEAWEFDGNRLEFKLRSGVRFSDGSPFSADDVCFTFRVLQDASVTSQLADTVRIDDRPIACEVVDAHTVSFELPRRTAGVERIFDSIRILSAERLSESLAAGTLESDTGTGADPESITGLGPFRLRRYAPGERIVLERNPYYFAAAEGLPELDAIVFEIVRERTTSLLRLQNGGVDLVDLIDPESFHVLSEHPPEGVALVNLGAGLMIERLWFNLNPESPIPEHKRAWFQDVRFRRAISLAIDREELARSVFLGLASPATGPVSPANAAWLDKSIGPFVHDVGGARALLAEAGFRTKKSGSLVDREGRPVTFTLLTRSDQVHENIGAFLEKQLSSVGIEMHVARPGALGERLTRSYDYEAVLLPIGPTDPDPSAEIPMWVSRSQLHFWHPSQSRPATPWEARIDALMIAQMAELDFDARKRALDEVQAIARDQMPMIELVVPHVMLATRSSVRDLRPSPFAHALWSSERIRVDVP